MDSGFSIRDGVGADSGSLLVIPLTHSLVLGKAIGLKVGGGKGVALADHETGDQLADLFIATRACRQRLFMNALEHLERLSAIFTALTGSNVFVDRHNLQPTAKK